MRLEIFVVSYNRPKCLRALLASLAKQHCSGWQMIEIHLMQDGPNPIRITEDSLSIPECIDIFQKTFPHGQVHAADQNIGINGNYTQIVERMKTTSADAVVVFEDDLELSPHYLNVLNRLLTHARTSPHVGMVSAKGLLGASAENQQSRKHALLPMGSAWGIHRWGWGMTRNVIAEYGPIFDMYLDYANRLGFPDNGDKKIRSEKQDNMLRFINIMGFFQTTNGIEIDTIFDLAAYVLGRVNLCTYANFLRSSGGQGVHFSENLFTASNLTNTTLMDEPPNDFAWYEPAMMLDVLTIIRRHHGAIRLNFNSSMFKSRTPFRQPINIELIRALYEDIFGWQLTEHDVLAHKYHQFKEGTQFWSSETEGLLRTSLPEEHLYSRPYAV